MTGSVFGIETFIEPMGDRTFEEFCDTLSGEVA